MLTYNKRRRQLRQKEKKGKKRREKERGKGFKGVKMFLPLIARESISAEYALKH